MRGGRGVEARKVDCREERAPPRHLLETLESAHAPLTHGRLHVPPPPATTVCASRPQPFKTVTWNASPPPLEVFERTWGGSRRGRLS